MNDIQIQYIQQIVKEGLKLLDDSKEDQVSFSLPVIPSNTDDIYMYEVNILDKTSVTLGHFINYFPSVAKSAGATAAFANPSIEMDTNPNVTCNITKTPNAKSVSHIGGSGTSRIIVGDFIFPDD